MKIYIAAKYPRRTEAQFLATTLRAVGHQVVSSWHEEKQYSLGVTLAEIPNDDLEAMARRDLREIDRSDCVLLMSQDPEEPTVRGARHVEFGYGLALRKTLVIYGPRENIFHHLNGIHVAQSLPQLLPLLAGLSR